MLQQWCRLIIEATAEAREPSAYFYREYLERGALLDRSVRYEEVEASTRESFARAFGLSVGDQLDLEKALVCHLATEGTTLEASPLVHDWFSASPGLAEPWVDASL